MSNLYILHKYYRQHAQFHVQHFFSKHVTTVQSNCIIFFQESLEIPALCKYVSAPIYKKTSSHEENLRDEMIRNSDAQFCMWFVETSSHVHLKEKHAS